MAKKKSDKIGSPIGYPAMSVLGDGPSVRDNNPDGPSRHPDTNLGGYDYNRGKQICFANNLGNGEGIRTDDVIVQNVNGVSRSRGQNPGQQSNYSPDSGWSESKDWDGGNLTGL